MRSHCCKSARSTRAPRTGAMRQIFPRVAQPAEATTMATEAEIPLAIISTMPRLCNQEAASRLAGYPFNSGRACNADQNVSSALHACSSKAEHGSIRANDDALNAVHGLSNWGTTFVYVRLGGEATIRPVTFPQRRNRAGCQQSKSHRAGGATSTACSRPARCAVIFNAMKGKHSVKERFV